MEWKFWKSLPRCLKIIQPEAKPKKLPNPDDKVYGFEDLDGSRYGDKQHNSHYIVVGR